MAVIKIYECRYNLPMLVSLWSETQDWMASISSSCCKSFLRTWTKKTLSDSGKQSQLGLVFIDMKRVIKVALRWVLLAFWGPWIWLSLFSWDTGFGLKLEAPLTWFWILILLLCCCTFQRLCFCRITCAHMPVIAIHWGLFIQDVGFREPHNFQKSRWFS